MILFIVFGLMNMNEFDKYHILLLYILYNKKNSELNCLWPTITFSYGDPLIVVGFVVHLKMEFISTVE